MKTPTLPRTSDEPTSERPPGYASVPGEEERSPLAAIRELEDRMAARIDAARAEADAVEARAAGDAERLEQAEHEEASRRAASAYEAALRAARQEAERIRADAADKARLLISEADAGLERAADSVIAFILPSEERGG